MRRLALLLLLVPLELHADLVRSSEMLGRASMRLGLPVLEQLRFVQLSYDSTIYNEAIGQGVEKESAKESFAFHLAREQFGWESKGLRGDGSVRWRRFSHPEPDTLLRIDFTEKWASAIRSASYRTERLRTARFLPHYVVREAQQRIQTARITGSNTLAYATPTGDVLDLHFDESGLLTRVSTPMAIPFRGDRVVSWEYSDWRPEKKVLLPGRVTIRIGDLIARDLKLEAVQWEDREADFFAIPTGLHVMPERKAPDIPQPVALGGTPQKVADGVWLAHNVTSGTSAMFIDHEDGITVLEAPAGAHYPQTDIPMPNLVRGATSSGPGEALVNLVHRTLPGRVIRRVVISHPHADHAGGVRALAADGAEIIVGEGAGEVVRAFLNERFVLEPDRFEQSRTRGRSTVREVRDVEIIGTGPRRLEIRRVRGNPHSPEMIAAWLPELKIVFQGDLFYPEPLESFPSPNRVPIMQWFAGWLEREKIDVERIYSTHGDEPATKEHLAKVRPMP